ncbi:cytochrome c [Noviherbaspirillum sp. Root189]|uniref:cytochrome c n=1 Tax=Noviherbaspirillum sp. Root189 TaxID=1736487 RepID=UPI00070D6958|nr:cytochrome c [Noviherbaspirillum sp. Root189]KRB84821.1 alcohol dehydrogenase [Noviherbaspirillum sp. Root189]
MKRFLLPIVAGVFILVAIPAFILMRDMFTDPLSTSTRSAPTEMAGEASRGRYLARAGNCMACHTVRGGMAYAGGRAISTPFGDIYTSNITPDPETGIGTWSPDDFWRALHHGKSKSGRLLYPAFPYTNYTNVTRADSDALFAYLKTVPPVQQDNRIHALRFPYNQPILLAAWRALYFRPSEYVPADHQTAQWNRGAYLVKGLGHCSACHTARNALGANSPKNDLAGGMMPVSNWYASALTSSGEEGLGDWRVKDVKDFLHTGVSARGAAFGPMAGVVSTSLQHLSGEDIEAMAIYLKSITTGAMPVARSAPAERSPEATAVLRDGGRLYERHCAECHQANGKGAGIAYPPLAGSSTLRAPSPVNAIRIVLNGGFAPVTRGNPRPYGMPPFGTTLNDHEIAAVVSYTRTSWGNDSPMVTPIDVMLFRGIPTD